ncbi:MAG: hypothetical protein JNM70_07285 [Anaerolineae bacterium]|nr:hypothetical protein [Anaerolineae bacterium]
MNPLDVIEIAGRHLSGLSGHVFDILSISKPVSPAAAVNLTKVISKLSPLLANLIEFNLIELLNDCEEFDGFGEWVRQDPGFPDAVFLGKIHPAPGLEIKAWFPLATEITARFKESQNHLSDGNTYVVLLAWIPEYVVYGKPKILNVSMIEGGSVAHARDVHYHNPPDYLVIEPEDTRTRTRNLRQTNTNGYKWQGTSEEFREAQEAVARWGENGRVYQPTPAYQRLLRQLLSRYPYRLDTNFAKVDRIVHPEIEHFKLDVQQTRYQGMTIQEWSAIYNSRDDKRIAHALETKLTITEADADRLVK